MKYLSVCSGIEAASAAWHELGWTPVAFSEIEPFPRAVLAHHYPNVPNWGDMTRYREWPDATVDVLVGGTPCQSFSVAGLRKGLDDPRGSLMLTFLGIAERYRPRYIVWENVPGVLSSNGGRDFGSFLGALGNLGYGWAYRVLDAQWFGVAQRRRRVFVVASLGDQRSAAQVLFEREGVCRDPAPRRAAEERPTAGAARGTLGGGGFGTDTKFDGRLIPEIANSITASMANSCLGHNKDENVLAFDAYNQSLSSAVSKTVAARDDQDTASLVARGWPADIAPTLYAGFGNRHGLENQHALGGAGLFVPTMIDASKDGTGSGTPLVPVHAFDARQSDVIQYGDRTGPIDTHGRSVAVAFQQTADCLTSAYGTKWNGNASADNGSLFARQAMQVRRLTPRECERLQGFPDDWTLIPWRGRPAAECPDSPRYKALGNSMAVPCMRWLGQRIAKVSACGSPQAGTRSG